MRFTSLAKREERTSNKETLQMRHVGDDCETSHLCWTHVPESCSTQASVTPQDNSIHLLLPIFLLL